MSKKSRFLGGLVGAGAVRGGTDSIFSETGGPLRFDDPTYGAMGDGMSMGSYTTDGIELTNSNANTRCVGIDLNLAGFTDNFFVSILNLTGAGLPSICQLGVSTYPLSSFSMTSSLDWGIVGGTARIQHSGSGFQADAGASGASGHINIAYNAMHVAFNRSSNKLYFGYSNTVSGSSVYWLKGSAVGSQQNTGSWTTTLPITDPTFDTDNWGTNTGQDIECLLVKLPGNSSVRYYAENWRSPVPTSFQELRNAVYSSSTTDVARTTPKSGILTLDEVGPEGDGTSLSLSQMNWGGISGRSAVIDTTNPSLDLNFDGTASSFTRATTAADAAKANGDQLATSIVTQNKTGTVQSMYMGPDGKLIKGYVTNLVNNSEMKALVGSPYAQYAMVTSTPSVTVNADTDPAGGSSASLITPGASTTSYYAGDALDYTAGTTYTFSSYFKVPSGSTFDGRVGFLLYGAEFNSGGGNITVYWNLETDGTATFNSSSNSPQDYGIIDVGDGWYRIWVTETCTDSGTAKVQQYPRVQGITATTDTLLQWGAQVEEGAAPSELVQTTSGSVSDQVARVEYDASGNPLGLLVEEQRTNIYPGTIPSNNTITFTANQGTAPDGTNTAIKAAEDNANGEKNGSTAQFSVTSGTQYTMSLFAKPAGRPGIRLLLPAAAFGDNLVATYNLQGSGSIIEWGGTNAPDATTITPAGNGWYRISITGTATSTVSTILQLVIDDDGTDTNTVYQGDGSSGLLIWGIQVEEGEGPTSYIPTTTTSLIRPADDITVSTSDFGFDVADSSTVIEASLTSEPNSSFPRLFEYRGSSTAYRIFGRVSSGNLQVGFADSATGTSLTSSLATGVTYPLVTTAGVAHTGTDISYGLDGDGAGSATSSGMSTALTTLKLGGQVGVNTNIINGHIRRLTYWPRAISDEQLAEYSGDLNFGGRMEYHGILSLNEVAQSRR